MDRWQKMSARLLALAVLAIPISVGAQEEANLPTQIAEVAKHLDWVAFLRCPRRKKGRSNLNGPTSLGLMMPLMQGWT